MNHSGTENTEKITEGYFDLALTALKGSTIFDGRGARLNKALCILCALRVSVVN